MKLVLASSPLQLTNLLNMDNLKMRRILRKLEQMTTDSTHTHRSCRKFRKENTNSYIYTLQHFPIHSFCHTQHSYYIIEEKMLFFESFKSETLLTVVYLVLYTQPHRNRNPTTSVKRKYTTKLPI